MKEMTIDEAHTVALDIMKEIHEFCMENDIKYTLAYGSLIGAIRHKGFIPWDDDIDIWMTRPNFEKFTQSFVSNRGYRLSSIYDEDSLINFDRVYETQRTYVKHGIKSCNGSTGIWVDIMPLDGVPDDSESRALQYKQFVCLTKEMKDARLWLLFKEQGGNIKMIINVLKMFMKKMRNGTIYNLSEKNVTKIHQQMVSVSKKYGYGNGEMCCYFQCGDAIRKNKQELLSQKSFDNFKIVSFENTELMIIEDYDYVLKKIYGDYMVLPPMEKRQKSHGKCFWK